MRPNCVRGWPLDSSVESSFTWLVLECDPGGGEDRGGACLAVTGAQDQ